MDPRTAKMLAEHERMAKSAPPPAQGFARVKEDARAWVKSHRSAARIGAAVGVVVLSLAGYYLIAVPALERDRMEMEARALERMKVETSARQAALDACLSKAQSEYVAVWKAACKARRQGAGCSLPARLVEEHERQLSLTRNACLMQHSLTGE